MEQRKEQLWQKKYKMEAASGVQRDDALFEALGKSKKGKNAGSF